MIFPTDMAQTNRDLSLALKLIDPLRTYQNPHSHYLNPDNTNIK